MASSSEVAVQQGPWLRAVAPHTLVVFVLVAFCVHTHYRGEWVASTLFWTALTFIGPRTRRFANFALPIVIVGILYDQVVPLLMPYRPEIHVADLYHAEKRLFPIHTAQGSLIPSEWFAQHTVWWLDLPCGFAYLTYMYESFLVTAWLYLLRDEERLLKFIWAFLLCNVIGMATWILFPAAPPWYVAQYGLGPAHVDAPASAAGAARFDALLGINYFAGFYTRNHDIFGAMPSLHVAYPVVVVLGIWTVRSRSARIAAALFTLLVAFAAVYLSHHYVLDAIMGVVVAVVSYVAVAMLVNRVRGPDRGA